MPVLQLCNSKHTLLGAQGAACPHQSRRRLIVIQGCGCSLENSSDTGKKLKERRQILNLLIIRKRYGGVHLVVWCPQHTRISNRNSGDVLVNSSWGLTQQPLAR